MKCPYRYSSTKHIEQTENNLVDEETGVNKGVTINYVETKIVTYKVVINC